MFCIADFVDDRRRPTRSLSIDMYLFLYFESGTHFSLARKTCLLACNNRAVSKSLPGYMQRLLRPNIPCILFTFGLPCPQLQCVARFHHLSYPNMLRRRG